ncbi:hypothetical protein ACFPOA_02070 [Lysobacter niabensis]|uniref:hypothetical protein n=1 Tax=Agrilutibacter niabensis TaxID=380628 RepID=UPI00361E20F9
MKTFLHSDQAAYPKHGFPQQWSALDLADAVPLRLSEMVTLGLVEIGLVEIARPLAAANSPFATPATRDWRRRGYVASTDLSSFRVR